MNIINRISILILAIASLASCAEKEEPIVYLDVNAHNISGSWKLAQWNGAALNDSTYMYVEFVRNDKTFTIYQNLDSFMNVPHKTQALSISTMIWNSVQSSEDSTTMIPATGLTDTSSGN